MKPPTFLKQLIFNSLPARNERVIPPPYLAQDRRPGKTPKALLLSAVTCICVLLLCVVSCTPAKKYTVANAHSHNDYANVTPFTGAFNEGFGSIEADIFPVNGELYVAHKKEAILPQNTLKAQYLDPLLAKLSADSLRRLNLLIDIKENHPQALMLLIRELQPLMKYLSTPGTPRNVTISISGERPPPADYLKYPGFIFFDDDLKLKHTPEQWQRVSLVSLPFDKISKWTGDGPVPDTDRKRLRQVIDSVHTAGKPFRFWAAPDTIPSWREQQKLRADLIGTDKITELGTFLRNGSR